jgi:cbb3-type cytochrome oxidase subunit 3
MTAREWFTIALLIIASVATLAIAFGPYFGVAL